jgi:hypothetical protein
MQTVSILRPDEEMWCEVHMKSMKPILLAFLVVTALAIPAALADTNSTTGPLSLSHVRIVRLSFVQGDVAIKHPGDSDWIAATVNTPIQEGFSIATTPNSFAEVEFENGSTARLGQGSAMDFTELALTPQGDKVNKLALTKGYATFHFTPEHHDQYEVDASGVTITAHGKTEFRTNFSGESLRLEVFDGEVQAVRGAKSDQIGKNRVATYDPNAVEAVNVSSGIDKDSWDQWTHARDQQSVLAANDQSVSPNSPIFGWTDLDTYGDWSFFPGYGYGWAPYEPAGWSPYSSGAWGNYPGLGFTWVSAEPWGWLPFHNGFWNYDASMGWFWTPGSLDAWSPAQVNWFAGDGWIGWEPMGLNGTACPIAAPGCLMAVAPIAVEQGTPLRPTSPILLHPVNGISKATRIQPPQLNGAHVAAHSVNALAVRPAAVGGAPVAESAMHASPTSVVMGREVTPDSFLNHHGFLSGAQPIHAQLGRTMGGTIPTVVGHNGTVTIDSHYHGPVAAGGSSPAVRMPTMMQRASASGGPSAAIGAHGGVTPVAASASSSSGFNAAAGGNPSAASAPASAPSATASPSSSGAVRSSSSSGPVASGGHR